MVRKSDSGWRPYGDFHKLNSATVLNKYPLQFIQDFIYRIADCRIFFKIDLVKAFFRIPLAEKDRLKTALTMPFGLFEFNQMPFELRNAAQFFQRFIDTALRRLDFCFGYDILASKDEEEHRQHLEIVFQRLKEYDITWLKANSVKRKWTI